MHHVAPIAALYLALLSLSVRAGSERAPATSEPVPRVSPSIESNQCGGASNLEDVQCIGRYIAFLDQELNRVYQSALRVLPEQDKNDNRHTREQLRKSERAWLRYKDEDCTLIGGVTGGSNLWVTHFAADCEVKRTRERIHFLQKLAAGQPIDE